MRTLEKEAARSDASGFPRIQNALREEAGLDLPDAAVNQLVRLAREQSAVNELANAMAHIGVAVPPAAARAAQAAENAVKGIEDEFGLLTSAQVAALLGSSSSAAAARSLANDMRGRGDLLYIRRLNRYLYPGFQFDHTVGRVLPLVRPLLQLAADSEWEPEDVVLWLCSATTYFDDETRPVDHLTDDPDRVLEVARMAWGVEW